MKTQDASCFWADFMALTVRQQWTYLLEVPQNLTWT